MDIWVVLCKNDKFLWLFFFAKINAIDKVFANLKSYGLHISGILKTLGKLMLCKYHWGLHGTAYYTTAIWIGVTSKQVLLIEHVIFLCKTNWTCDLNAVGSTSCFKNHLVEMTGFVVQSIKLINWLFLNRPNCPESFCKDKRSHKNTFEQFC